MHLFPFYAGEQRVDAATPLRLRQAGHDLFFKNNDLPPAESSDHRSRRDANGPDALRRRARSPPCVFRGWPPP